MKISYTNGHNCTQLKNIGAGTVFRPTNSRALYIRTDTNGNSLILNDRCQNLWGSVADIQSNFEHSKITFEETHDYEELILCIDLANGGAILFYEGIEIECPACDLLVDDKGE